jgi:hypothetical protein
MNATRRPWAWLAVFALVVVLLLVGVAAVLRARSSAEAPAASGSPSADAGAAARSTAGAVTEPAIEPTAAPTAGPTGEPAAPARRTSLAAFARHVRRAVEDGGALLVSLREAAQAFDIPTVRSEAAAVSAWADVESGWLDDHPPRACYADVHTEYRSAIDDFAEAAEITERFATDFPFADFEALERALDLANSGAASMQAASDLIASVRC